MAPPVEPQFSRGGHEAGRTAGGQQLKGVGLVLAGTQLGLSQPGLAGSAEVGKTEDRSLCPCCQKHWQLVTLFGDRSL